MKFWLSFFLFISTAALSKAQKHIPLYSDTIPNAIDCSLQEEVQEKGRIIHVTHPELIAYLPEKPDSLKTAVIFCPGGGYARLAMDHEGSEVAKAFNQMGIAAFVLKYRLPNDTCMTNKKIVPLQDAQQAMYLLKMHAQDYGINPSQIGIIGFSAGGHLAAMLSTHYDFPSMPFAKDSLLKPRFSILVYPVISMNDSICHSGSKKRLFGKSANQQDVDFFSCEKNVKPSTPPTFMILAADDKTVDPENSIIYYNQLRKNKVAAELHLFQNGGHGFGMHLPNKYSWIELLNQWLKLNKFIKGI